MYTELIGLGDDAFKSIRWVAKKYRKQIVNIARKAANQRGDRVRVIAFRRIPVGIYASIMSEIKIKCHIKYYETCNIFLPCDIKPGSSEANYLESLNSPGFMSEKNRLQIFSKERIRNWWIEWKPLIPKTIDNFIYYVINEFHKFQEKYGSHFNNYWLTNDEYLIREGIYCGEYVVLNQNTLIRYNIDTQILEYIKHKSFIGSFRTCLFSSIHSSNYLKLSSNQDVNISSWIRDYISKVLII